ISTAKADSSEIRRMGCSPYAVSGSEHRSMFSQTVPFPMPLQNYCCDDWREAQDVKILEAYDHSLPQEEKDPRSFTLPYFIHNVCFDKAFVDLGASILIIRGCDEFEEDCVFETESAFCAFAELCPTTILGGIFRQQQGMTNNGWIVDRFLCCDKGYGQNGMRLVSHTAFLILLQLLFLTTVVDEIYPVFLHCYTLYQLLSGSWLLTAYEMGRKMATASSSSMASKDTGMMMVSQPKPVSVHQLKCTQSNQVIEEMHEFVFAIEVQQATMARQDTFRWQYTEVFVVYQFG
ncbi:hypothetical protein Tco_1356992, partial [Tanacetum coccineum]